MTTSFKFLFHVFRDDHDIMTSTLCILHELEKQSLDGEAVELERIPCEKAFGICDYRFGLQKGYTVTKIRT